MHCSYIENKTSDRQGKTNLSFSSNFPDAEEVNKIDRNINFHRITLASNYSLSKKCNALPTDTVINTYTSTYSHLNSDWTFMFFVVFTSNKIPFWNLHYFTLYLNDSTHHIYITRNTYISVEHRKKELCPFTVSLKITLFSFDVFQQIKKQKSEKKLKQSQMLRICGFLLWLTILLYPLNLSTWFSELFIRSRVYQIFTTNNIFFH